MIFVNSMSDLFHKAVPKGHIAKVFDTMEQADWHIYQVLTKRSSLLQKFINERYKAPMASISFAGFQDREIPGIRKRLTTLKVWSAFP